MTSEYKNALAEVDCILGLASDEIIEKIPNTVLNFIKNQKNQNYKLEINDELSLSEQNLMKETRAIISLIYRSYLCSPSMKRKYKIDDEIELIKENMRLQEKYNPESLFKKSY